MTEFTLDEAAAQAVRENGLLIEGDNITIKKIVLCSEEERAAIKDPLAKLERYDENNRDEYWLTLPRYAISPDENTTVTINISGSGTPEAFYNTYDEQGEHRHEINITTNNNGSLTLENFSEHFCIAPTSGKFFIESIVIGDGNNNIVIESDYFDGYEAYAPLTVPDYSLNWNVSAFITAKDLKAAGAKAGDVLKITADSVQITPEDGEPYPSCCLSVYPFCSEEPAADGIDGYTYWTLTQEMINKGIILRGECKITGISLCAKSGETRNPVTETVQEVLVSEPVQFVVEKTWQDENGNNCEEFTTLTFDAGRIYHAGDILRLYISAIQPEACFMAVTTCDDNGLNNDLRDEYGNYDIWSGMPCIDIPLSAEDVAKIEKLGFRIFGKGFTLNRAELVSETEVGKTSVLAEVPARNNYVIDDPLSFLPENAQVAYVVADVYGNEGCGDISHNSPTYNWIQGHPEPGGELHVGFEPWRFDFTEDKPLESGSQICIQNYNEFPIMLHEVRFYNANDEVIFTLDASKADLNVIPCARVYDGDEFWLNPGYFLGEDLYARFDHMVIKTNGSNYFTVGYVDSNGEYTETPAESDTIELSKSVLGEDWVKLVAANGAVALISVTYYDENGEVLKVLDYTNVEENFIPPVPFTTLAKGDSYRLSPYALLSAEQLAQLHTIVVETTGDGSSGGAFSWDQYNEDKTDDKGNPAPGYDWTCSGDFTSGSEWRFENFTSIIDNSHPVLSINCWWDEVEGKENIGESRVGIAAIRFEDAEGNEILRIDAENMPKTICAVEPPVSEVDDSHNYVINIAGILEKIGSELTAEDIRKVEVRTLGLGGLNVGRNEMVGEKLTWTSTDWINAGGVAFVDVNLSDEDGRVTIQNWDDNNVFELYSVSLYDENSTLIVTLDASNAYLNSEHTPIFSGIANPAEDLYEGTFIYTDSILKGLETDASKVAYVDIEAYGRGVVRAYNGGDNDDKFFDFAGWTSIPVTLEEGSSVINIEATDGEDGGIGELVVMQVAFKNAQGEIIAVLDDSDIKKNVPASSDKVLFEINMSDDVAWNNAFIVNSKQLLGDNFSKLARTEVKVKGYGNGGIGWNNDYAWTDYPNDCLNGGISTWTATGKPSEAHGNIAIMSWWMYQSIESVTFYDADDKVLFVLNADNAELNTETLDCTDYVKFNMYDYPLTAQPENSIWFAPKMKVAEGGWLQVTVKVPADVSDENPSVIYLVSGEDDEGNEKRIAEYTLGYANNIGKEYICSFEIDLDKELTDWINENGVTVCGDKLKVSHIVAGKVDAPVVEANPEDGKVILTWNAVPGADEYTVYQYDDEFNASPLVTTTDTTYTVENLTNGQEYRFFVVACKQDLESTYIEYNDATAATPYAFNVTGHSLLLGDDIGVNFYMDIADSILADSTAEVKFTVNGRETLVPVSGAAKTESGYKFTCRVAAAEMNDVIKGQLYVGGEALGDEFTYSVKTYADYILAHDKDYGEEVSLVKAMLNYGAAAEKYFRGQTEMEFNKPEISAEDLAQYQHTVTDNDSVIDYVGQVIALKSKVTAKLYFSGKEFALSDFAVTENGYAVETSRLSIGSDKNGTYLAISGIAADEMANVFEVTVGGVTVGNYSVYSYVLGAIDSDIKGLSDVVAALCRYGNSAYNYRAQ